MTKFEAEKFCARAKLHFGLVPALLETFLKNVAHWKGTLRFKFRL
jgi:hypothetical protein